MPAKEEHTVIGQGTRVSIALLAMIFGVTTTAAAGGAAWATQITARLESIEKKLESSSDVWTESDMKAWSVELGLKNPTLSIPPPEHRYMKDL